MKIAISGTANSGKSTLIRQFLNTWSNYKSPINSYRDELKAKGLSHSKETSEETQQLILNSMIKQLEENKDEKYIIYDRCPLDVLVYTVAASDKGLVSDDFVTDTILKVRDALSLLDIIFVLPYNEEIKIEDNGTRETDISYIKTIDTIFQNLLRQYYTDFEANVFFPVENCPGIIQLETNNKISEIKTVINSKGDVFTVEDDIKLQNDLAKSIGDAKKSKALLDQIIKNQEALLPKVDISKLKL